MDIRPYAPADSPACLEFCAPPMRADFEQFLTSPGTFFVMEHDQKLVGYGGFSIQNASAAALRWGTIHPDFRRMGLGRFLLMYRMREIGRAGNIATVSVQPPPEFSGFYEKQGFRPAGTVLLKKLAVCP